MRTQTYRSRMLLALALFLSMASLSVRADVTSVTLTAPGTYGVDDDYFSTVWGNPRDMEDADDLYVIYSECQPLLRPKWTNISMSNGVWRGTTSNVGESRWLTVLNPGWVSSLDYGEDGGVHPIDTGHYTQLTFRMRVANGAGTSRPRIEWANGPIGEAPARGRKYFEVRGDGRWHIYSVNMGLLPTWTSGPVSWLWFQFEELPAGYLVEIDWVRLTPRQTRRIRWQGDPLSGSARLYLGPNAAHPEQYGDLLFYEGEATPEPIVASAKVRTVPASLPSGRYYARVEAGGTGANSTQSWSFLPLPVARVTAPGYSTGEDWATAVLGNPWDMNGLDDINPASTAMGEIESLRVKDGVLTIVSRDDGKHSCEVPAPHQPLGLNMGGLKVDQNKYRYFSYRYKVDEVPNQGAGGVHRIRWQERSDPNWPTGRTDDISFYNNAWRTYGFDLRTVRQEGELGEWRHIPADVMQIMIHESHRQWHSYLDWVRLTAENEAFGSYVVRWNVVGTNEPLTTTLYWAQKVQDGYRLVPGTGEVVSTPTGQGVHVNLGHELYLPLVLEDYGGGGDELQHAKSTRGLTVGQPYYVAVKLDDGYNETTWYSEVPVYVR